GINSEVGGILPGDMLEAMTRDKKVSGGRIRFVLQDEIGKVRIHDDVTDDEINDGIKFMLEYAEK
ncbi:MAG: 3-dehydroquinate synthase, partial [Candidatus Latescibacteria bacterium]|nr:3-dehydroquinate synthase [Candidatus Latescibacterota bacterium]